MKIPILTIILTLLTTLGVFGQTDNLHVVKRFAETYNPGSKTKHGVPTINVLPDSILTAFNDLIKNDQNTAQKYLVLTHLKLYKAHLQCCNQSYDISSSTKKFNKFVELFNIKNIDEGLSSGFIYDWINEHTTLKTYEPISKEIESIERELLRINKSVKD